jgi:hypothetical protein
MRQRAEKEEHIRQQAAGVWPNYEQTDEEENRNGHADGHYRFVPEIALFVIVAAHSKLAPFQNR